MNGGDFQRRGVTGRDKVGAVTKMTEAEVLGLLRDRYTKGGNGGNGQYAFIPHVRNGAGFNASRTFDAIVIDLWPSRGLTIDGFEVKVSRSDWLRELAQPAKADDACKVVDRFWVAAPQAIVAPGELPPTWGLLEVTGKKLVQKIAAPYLRPLEATSFATMSRSFMVGILRSIPTSVPTLNAEGELVAEYNRGVKDGREQYEEARREAVSRAQRAELTLSQFGQIMGITLGSGWDHDGQMAEDRIKEIASGLRAVLKGDEEVTKARAKVDAVVHQLREEADRIEAGRRW